MCTLDPFVLVGPTLGRPESRCERFATRNTTQQPVSDYTRADPISPHERIVMESEVGASRPLSGRGRVNLWRGGGVEKG